MSRKDDEGITDDALLTRIVRLVAPPDRRVMLNLALGMAELERTGETAALDTAIEAFWARVDEKQKIART
jgi:hypothetical protein